ncbi:MAG: hypothetical protein SFX73_19325 [Kofleriaceae bacterium]|nr:hypothetical protein [Kofleriaceae bacterium]
MRRAAFVLLLTAVTAEAAPRTLTSTYEVSENVHMAGQRGAMNRRTDLTVTITLGDRGKLGIVAVGTDRDHVLNGSTGENTAVDTAWRTRWSGTWQERGDTLVLSLGFVGQQCTKEETSDRVAPTTLRCKMPSKRARIVCASEDVDVRDATLQREPVWRCRAEQGELGETYPYWVAGKRACLRTHGGRGGSSYARC